MSDTLETPYVKMWIDEGILYCVYAENLSINLDIAIYCVAERIKFTKAESYPCLVDIRGLKHVTKEAREYFAKEGAEYITAGAFIVGSIFTEMMGNIFIYINKPNIPTRLFTDEKAAEEWLRKFVTHS